MKTVLTKLLAFSSVALLMLASCKKDETKVVATSGKPGTLKASTSTVVLTKADIANNAITFTLSSADYGFKAAVINTLQIDIKGDGFAHPKSYVISGGTYTQNFSVPDFNALLLALNLPTGKESQVEARISSQISLTSAPVYSNTVALSVTPFALITYVYVPGEYQNTSDPNLQWSPGTADSLVSPAGNGIYTGYIHFLKASSPFKVTPAKNWSASYGDAGGGAISLSSGGNILSPTAPGLYLVTVDTNAGTISFTPYNHVWSVIGNGAKGWDAGDDVDMAFNQNANVYQVSTALVSSGQIKFRADHDWGLSLGDVTPVTGILTSNNGGNINVPSNGTYLISLSFGDPLAGPSYKLTKQ